ncbi:MAG: glycosyltransferase family 2 protein [Lachnospiraceae bacterium]|nr:glycosyltransferase family 2 protein [Lachnospiraceae bacterium]
MKKNKVLVIIPAYNEEDNIVRVVEQFCDRYSQYDYVVINDGSRDHTADICMTKGYNILDLPINLGLAGAFQTGMKYADQNGYEYAIQFDADGQHMPEYIEDMLDEMEKGFDIVIGSRFVTDKKPHNMRMLGSNLISLAIQISTGKKIKDPTSGMRMYNKNMISKFANALNYGPEPDTMSHLLRNDVKISEVQVKMQERIAGESYLKPFKAIAYMIRMLCSILIIQNFRKREKV